MLYSCWQLVLDADLQIPSISWHQTKFTHWSAFYTSRRTLSHIYSRAEWNHPSDHCENTLFWLDDLLLHDENIFELQQTAIKLFKLYVVQELNIHLTQCTVFATTCYWCGFFNQGRATFWPDAHVWPIFQAVRDVRSEPSTIYLLRTVDAPVHPTLYHNGRTLAFL